MISTNIYWILLWVPPIKGRLATMLCWFFSYVLFGFLTAPSPMEPGAGGGWAHLPVLGAGVSRSHSIAQTPKKTGNPTPWLPASPWSKCGDLPFCPEIPAWRSSRCPWPLAVFSDFLPPRFSGGLLGWDNQRPEMQTFVSQSLVASAGHPTTLPTPTLNWTIAQVFFRSKL